MTPQDVKAAVERLTAVALEDGGTWLTAIMHVAYRDSDTRSDLFTAADLRTLLESHSALTAEVERCRSAYGASPSSPPSGESGQWQDIESAPKDGTPILLYCEAWGETWGEVREGCWHYSGWETAEGNVAEDEVAEPWQDAEEDEDGPVSLAPSHWMPLPNPPGASPAGEAAFALLRAALEPFAKFRLEGFEESAVLEVVPSDPDNPARRIEPIWKFHFERARAALLPNPPASEVSALGHGKPLSDATSDPLPDSTPERQSVAEHAASIRAEAG